MLDLLTLLTGMALGSSTIPQPASVAALGHFRLVVERSDSGFVARCEAGCTWKEIAFRCAADCQVLIDANGVALNPKAKLAPSPFAFHLQPTLDGWTAKSVTGTAWITLSYGCATFVCRARVNEFGVSGLGPR